MSFMPWSDAFELGVTTIDDQHRWLVDATNRLHDELHQATPDRATLGKLLEGLVDYTMNHFVLEEDLFLRFGYEDTAAHKAEHDTFTAGIMQLLLRFEAGDNIGQETLDLLKHWLSHHILVVDKAYVPYLKQHNIT